MSSTRNRSPIAAAALLLATGCLKTTEPPAALSRSPLVIDEAMERRQWAAVPVKYQNGQTPAWPTGFILAHNPDAPRWAPVVTDAPLFLANVLALPAGYVVTPPWTRVTYTNGAVPPTYNAMPPLQPSQE